MASGDIIKSEFPMVAVEPWCVRKLVEQAAQYARGLGFARHPDYMKAARVFGGLRTKQFAWHFNFGREGKPCCCRGQGKPKRRPAASCGNWQGAAVLVTTIMWWP